MSFPTLKTLILGLLDKEASISGFSASFFKFSLLLEGLWEFIYHLCYEWESTSLESLGTAQSFVQFWNVYLRISSVIFGEKSKEKLINAIAR